MPDFDPPPRGYRIARRLAHLLPRDVRTRVFEPAFEDARIERAGAWCVIRIVAQTLPFAVAACFQRRQRPSLPPSHRASHMDSIGQDLRFAARMLLKNPGFTAVAVMALALGIGANASIFSLIYGLFVRPLPYTAPGRLVRLWGESTDGRLVQLGASVPKFEHIRSAQTAFDGVAADSGVAMSLTRAGDEPQRVIAATVSANYFDILGIRAMMGRTFLPSEEERASVAVVTRGFWTQQLGADPNVVGRALTLDARPYIVIGVVGTLPQSDVGPTAVFLPFPYALSGLTPELRQRGVSYMRLTARLKPGVSIERARDEAAELGRTYQAANREKADSSWREIAIPIREDLTGSVRPAILTLLGAVALVLLIACSNVANLLTARFAGRRREIALRGALGAPAHRIVRLFLVESVILALAGALVGLGVASACLRALPAFGGANLPLDEAAVINQPVLWVTVLIALATGVLMGVYPAVQAARPATAETLKDGGRGTSGGRGQHRVRSALVACQVGLSLMLLVGAALLMTSFATVRNQQPGFDAGHVLTANIALPPARYASQAAQDQFHDRVVTRIRAIPGVRSAALGVGLPLTGNDSNAPFARGDGAVAPLNQRPLGLTRSITPGYFATLSIPLLEGRDFAARDTADAPPVIIISQSAARKMFPDVDPVGRTLITGSLGGGIRCEIVGVVGDVRSVSLAKANDVEFYRPFTQRGNTFAEIAVRAEGDPMAVLGPVRAAVRAIDPELPLNQPAALSAVVDTSLGQRQLLMALLALFAGLAVVLATVGIYSVVAYLVGQRTSEIGIRLALGASAGNVLRQMMWEGLRPVSVGLLVGIAGVWALGRLIASQLYGVSALDPATLAAATLLLGSIAFVACVVPARRAAKVDPLMALRAE